MKKTAHFNELFQIHSDGSLEPKKTLQVGRISFGKGVRFSKGVSFAGIDFTLFIGRDFAVEEDAERGITKILGIYQ